MPEMPKFEQVKEFLKNATDDHIRQMKELIQLREDVMYQRYSAIKATIVEFYPELKSLWDRDKRLAAIRFLKNWGWEKPSNGLKAWEQFNIRECKDALEEEFGKPVVTQTEEDPIQE